MGGEDKLSLLRSRNYKGAGGRWGEKSGATGSAHSRHQSLQDTLSSKSTSRYQRKSSRLEVKNRAKDRGKDGWSKI